MPAPTPTGLKPEEFVARFGAPTFAIPEPVRFDRLLSLEGRRAVVTGGSRSIGEAIVLRLAEAGAFVVMTARGQEALAKVEAKVAAMGGHAAGTRYPRRWGFYVADDRTTRRRGLSLVQGGLAKEEDKTRSGLRVAFPADDNG